MDGKTEKGLKIVYDTDLDNAIEIAREGIGKCMGKNRCGCRGAVIAEEGYEDGIWLYDSLRTFNDGIIYWAGPDESRNYLFAETPGSMGVVTFFTSLQETEGEYAGNIPITKYLPWKSYPAGYYRNYDIDYGGMFDVSCSPRRNHRDEVAGNSVLVHSMLLYWKLFNDISCVRKYYEAMARYAEFRAEGVDEATGLYKSTFGLGDICVNNAVPESCALVYNNAECMQLFEEFAELALAVGKEEDGNYYRKLAEKMRRGINLHLWGEDLKYYKVKIFSRLVTDEKHPFFGVREDSRFFVGENSTALYYEIPDSKGKIDSLLASIEKSDGKFRLYGTSVTPAYPDGWFPKLMDGHNYWNGDIWPVRGSAYAMALFRLGYPDRGIDVLSREAAVIARDKAFYEYYEADEECRGKGAFNNCFSVSPFILALVKGLFGMDADYPGKTVYIHPSLRHSGNIRCQLGLYSFEANSEIDKKADAIKLAVNTDYCGQADFKVLMPNNVTDCCVEKNHRKIPSEIKQIGDASYAVFVSKLEGKLTTFEISGHEAEGK